MLASASLGGWLLALAAAHEGHSMAHVIGSRLHMPHGRACAYAAPVMLEFIAPAVPARVKKTGLIPGAGFSGTESPEEIGAKTSAAYRNFVYNTLGLEPLNVRGADIEELAGEVAHEPLAALCPRAVNHEDALVMLKGIFA